MEFTRLLQSFMDGERGSPPPEDAVVVHYNDRITMKVRGRSF